jgi:hypothetical protein
MPEELDAALPLKEFLQIEHCPPGWRYLNLYLIRDAEVVVYVGKSYVAFQRVWQHFYDGFKGRSLLGRFIVCYWPVSMRFTVELMISRLAMFEPVEHELDRSEQMLIQQCSPCLNTALNPHPTPIPEPYFSPYTSLKYRLHPKRFIHQAAQAIEAEQKKAWLEQRD